MSGPIAISSVSQWDSILSSHNAVVADFYADWCGPCKMIAPIFERLANENAVAGKLAFVKVNVDSHSSISRSHGVTAMPTFILFHNGRAIKTLRGANPSDLAALVGEAAKLKGQGKPGASFATPGRTLGGEGVRSRPGSFDAKGLVNSLVTFFGLYFASLLSFDPYKAAESSTFNVNKRTTAQTARASSGNVPSRPAQRPTFKTLSDLGSD
ncbi:hypothetical protein VUR80DRAFT_5725 [Thermomyces stellatus]